MKSVICTTLLSLFFLVSGFTSLFAVQPDSLSEAGWNFIKANQTDLAKKTFQEVIAQDKYNFRANLGLAFIFEDEENLSQSWNHFEKALTSSGNPHPYFFSALITPKISRRPDSGEKNVNEYFNSMIANGDSSGILRGMAYEHLGRNAKQHGDNKKADQFFSALNTVDDWMLVGPFDNTSGSGYEKVFPPETGFYPDSVYKGKNSIPVEWYAIPALRRDKWVDFEIYYPQEDAVFYANTFLFSEKDQVIQLRIGTSGSFKAFVNDFMVMSSSDENNNDLDTYIVEFELKQGWNRLLIKNGYSEISSCNFMVRLTDKKGFPVTGIRVEKTKHDYKPQSQIDVSIIPQFAEVYFQDQITKFPTRLENYLLLADAYLRNDKATEAEILLKKGLEIAPNNLLLLIKLQEANTRGEKGDENSTIFEKIARINPNQINLLIYRFYRALNNDEYDQAEKIVEQIGATQNKSETYYTLKSKLFSNRKEQEKVYELNHEAYKKFPGNEDFVSTEITYFMQVKQDYDECLKIANKFLEKNVTTDALFLRSVLYLLKQNRSEFNAGWEEIFKNEPCAPAQFAQLANINFRMQEYDEAEKNIKSALSISPSNSDYWLTLGEIYRVKNDTLQAIRCYKKVQTFSPMYYDGRAKLRELEGKAPIFSMFHQNNIDSLIASAPESSAYPDDNAIILLDDTRRIIYENGGSELMAELLVKMYKKEGVDRYKEHSIFYFSRAEGLNIEKAVVRKQNGDEIRADENGGTVVFKNLEINDCIYIKYKLKSYYQGKLSDHTWESPLFSYDLPVQKISYSVFAEGNRKIFYRPVNTTLEPVVIKVKEGSIYTWEIKNLEKVKVEPNMIPFADVAVGFQVTTIPDWNFLVNWYQDLTRDRLKSTYEIKAQVKQLIPDGSVLPDSQKVKIIHDFIKKNIRYSYVSFRQSGLVPQRARDVLTTRIGDCKDMATLCISMLKEAGITAWYVLVNTRDEGLFTNSLPGIQFNHCIVAAEFNGKLNYMDLTAEDYPIGSLPLVDIHAFSLLIKPGVGQSQLLPSENLIPAVVKRKTIGTLSETGHLKSIKTSVRFGASTAYLRSVYSGKSKEDQIKEFLDGNSDFPHLSVNSLTFNGLDSLTTKMDAVFDLENPDFATEVGGFKLFKMDWMDSFADDDGFTLEARKTTMVYYSTSESFKEEIILNLPKGYKPVELIKENKVTSPLFDYVIKFKYEKGILTGLRELKVKKSLIPVDEYPEIRKSFFKIKELDKTQILLKKAKS